MGELHQCIFITFFVKQGKATRELVYSLCYRAAEEYNFDSIVYFPILFRIFIVSHVLNTPLFSIYTKLSNNQTLLDFREITVIYVCENVHRAPAT